MLLFRLMSALLGYVVILVTGKATERFVNMAASRGIYLWDITRVREGAVLLKVRLGAVKALRHIARRTKCRFHFERRVGFPFLYKRLLRRKALALGVLFFLGALYFLSSFVWFIEVKGTERLTVPEVLGAAAEAGLNRGMPKWRVEPGRVEAALEEKLPLVAWTGVYIKGAKVTIEVAERVVPDAEDNRPSHIIATKAGLVKDVLVLNGHPAVKEGDTVSPGQVLISGEIPPLEEPPKPGEEQKQGEEANKPKKPSRFVHARGIVRARVWYDGYGEAKIAETGRRLTGRSETRVSIKFKGKEIILSGDQNIPYELYETETFVKTIPQWRNLEVPVELVTIKYFEMAEYREELGIEGARSLAGERALAEAAGLVPEEAGIVNRSLEEVQTGHPENIVRVKVTVETIEEIGAESLFKP
ncbi:putative stage IV sporulation protein YqfD [Pelotomaculum schinkii]|uniref:Putative stage IV sporulation protein YqfD n=1 Tax=Pelotomaculum schinkii TaxID=78350 RepID=A0A4Y7RFW0_9FIRM|nr:sporulation protein YqfD [Pelotomaculum schinkii]TEB07217.1 putative stage IV sporulation protein YqfD [Pelotomaculum schinkii]